MTTDQPLVSIGVPVYNDGSLLRNALERLLTQDYRNLEIILADDGSTDGSREICREYAKRDARIRLFENKHNLGAYGNHKFVFDVSTGDYFAWGSGHDYVHPAFISRLLENLQANPSVVMCCPQSVFMDENEEIFRTTKGGLDTRSLPPAERFEKLLVHLVSGGTANIFYGLYRQESLAQVDVTGQDVIILGELSLLGEMTQVNEVLYHRLVNKAEVGGARKERHTRMMTGSDGFSMDALMPYVGLLFGYMKVIERSNLPVMERQYMYETISRETDRIRMILADEMKNFVIICRKQLDLLDGVTGIQAYYAAQVLDGVHKLQALGFDSNEIKSIAIASARILKKRQKQTRKPLGKMSTRFGRLKGLYRKIHNRFDRLKKMKSGDKQ